MKKSDFDRIIKDNLILKCGEYAFGYIPTGNKKTYELYYSNFEFDKFKRTMQKENLSAFNQFNEGKGSELEERPYKGVMVPPKMASVASSSRFAYIALSNLGVTFEKECEIKDISGIAPQIDAYLSDDNTYFEVKCHEIFDDHKLNISSQYWKYIYGNENDFGFEKKGEITEKQFSILPEAFGISSKNRMKFDLKQFLCHLLGIKSREHESAALVYLFFKPKSDNEVIQSEINAIFSELAVEITNIFDSEPVRTFTEIHNISLYAIAEESYVMEPVTNGNHIKLY